MTIKSILVSISRPEVAQPSLTAAIDVAKSYQAHIDVLHVRPDSRIVSAVYAETTPAVSAGDMIARTEKRALENALDVRAACARICEARAVPFSDQALPGSGVALSWLEQRGYEDRWVRHYGRLADLIVFSNSAKAGLHASLSIEAALRETGRPVLLVPAKLPPQIGSNIAIAWNGSAESARAVGEARCFLRRARSVTILSADEPGKETCDPEGLRSYLNRHGVLAGIARVNGSGDVGKALWDAAGKAGADLLVMGAYSHSRFHQIVFGGVTHHALTSATTPVLMAH